MGGGVASGGEKGALGAGKAERRGLGREDAWGQGMPSGDRRGAGMEGGWGSEGDGFVREGTGHLGGKGTLGFQRLSGERGYRVG